MASAGLTLRVKHDQLPADRLQPMPVILHHAVAGMSISRASQRTPGVDLRDCGILMLFSDGNHGSAREHTLPFLSHRKESFATLAALRLKSESAQRPHNLAGQPMKGRAREPRAELEPEVEGRLFHRTVRSFTPTALAQRLQPEAHEVAAAVERFQSRASSPDRPAGTVRLATAEELAGELLVPSLGALWAVAPDIDLVLEGRSEVVSIGPGGADLALRVVRPKRTGLRHRRDREQLHANRHRARPPCWEGAPTLLLGNRDVDAQDRGSGELSSFV